MKRGAYRHDGSWIGYDYEQQAWIDTATSAKRDPKYKTGSANNPLADYEPDRRDSTDLEDAFLMNLPHDA